jgi:hypothetical protein
LRITGWDLGSVPADMLRNSLCLMGSLQDLDVGGLHSTEHVDADLTAMLHLRTVLLVDMGATWDLVSVPCPHKLRLPGN